MGREALFDRDTLSQIPRLVHVAAAEDRRVISQKLQRYHAEQRLQRLQSVRNIHHVAAVAANVLVALGGDRDGRGRASRLLALFPTHPLRTILRLRSVRDLDRAPLTGTSLLSDELEITCIENGAHPARFGGSSQVIHFTRRHVVEMKMVITLCTRC